MKTSEKVKLFLKKGKYQHGDNCETVECPECICGLKYLWEIAYNKREAK